MRPAITPDVLTDESCAESLPDLMPESVRRLRSIQYIERCLDLGLVSEAWQALEAASKNDRQDPALLAIRARVYLAAGMPEAAGAVIKGLERLLVE